MRRAGRWRAAREMVAWELDLADRQLEPLGHVIQHCLGELLKLSLAWGMEEAAKGAGEAWAAAGCTIEEGYTHRWETACAISRVHRSAVSKHCGRLACSVLLGTLALCTLDWAEEGWARGAWARVAAAVEGCRSKGQ